MAKEVDGRIARRGLEVLGKLPPGVIMVTLWFIGVALFLSLAMTLHLVASVLTEVYAGS